MVGSIMLDGRPYMLAEQRAITRSNANQMAAKLGSGAGDYDDLQNWDAWLMDDWRAGVGKKDPQAGGFLTATAETRFSNQICLPQHTRINPYYSPLNPNLSPAYDNALRTPYTVGDDVTVAEPTTLTIGADQTYIFLAVRLQLGNGETLNRIELWLPGQDDTDEVTVELWSDVDDEPWSILDTTTVSLLGRVGQYWHLAEFATTQAPSTETNYWIVIYPTDVETTTLTVQTNKKVSADHASYNGASWVASTYSFLARYHTSALTTPVTKVATFNGGIYIASDQTLYTHDYAVIKVFDEEITDLLATGDRLYVGQGDTENYWYMDTGLALTQATAPARLLVLDNGYLWRAYNGYVAYTADDGAATPWPSDQIIQVANRGYKVRGMAGFNGELIVSTDVSLCRIATGDIVLRITAWGYASELNGAHMLNFQGQLFISLGESLVRWDGDSLLPYGPDLGEGLSDEFAGNIVGLASNNNWMLCAVAGEEGSVWAHNGQGWHQVAKLPAGATLSSLDTVGLTDLITLFNRRLVTPFFVGTVEGLLYTVAVADTPKALRRLAAGDVTVFYEFFAWLETDWFYGNLREVDKDWESIFVAGENIDTSSYIEVYFQDSDSTDWELLGTVTESDTELRWSDLSTRPNSRRVKVALAIYNSAQRATPLVTAVRVKYQPMITDRWRWQFSVVIADNPEMLDGERSLQEADSQIAHLDTLTKQVAPFIFRDTDGKQFEVKLLNCTRSPERSEYHDPDADTDTSYTYSIVIEQVTADEYLAT